MGADNLITGRHFALAMLLVASLCNCSALSSKAINKAYFVPVVGLPEAEASKLYAVGKLKSGVHLTLLQSGLPETCIAKSLAFTKQSELSGAYFTELSGSCETPKEFGVAIAKKPVRDYERLTPKEISEADEVTKTDRLTRNSRALSALLKKAQGSIPGDLKELEGSRTKVYLFSLLTADVTVVSYEEGFPENTGVSGPRAIIINGHVYPLTGWCSYRTLNVFRLNGEHYVQSGSCCCGCGITAMELFRITSQGIVQVLSDYSLSD
jgi:hypothetical protein